MAHGGANEPSGKPREMSIRRIGCHWAAWRLDPAVELKVVPVVLSVMLENFSVGPDLRFWIHIVLCSCHRLRIARIVSYHQSMYCISLDAIYFTYISILFLVRSISWFRVLPSFCCTKNVNKTTNLKPYTLELCMAMQHDSIWDRNNNETEPDSGWSSIRGHLRKMSRHSGKRDSTKDKSISDDLERRQSAYVKVSQSSNVPWKAEAQHLGDGHARRGQDDLLRGVVKLTMYETKYMCIIVT